MAPKITPQFHPKGWGSELWIVNNENYCGKILSFNSGKRFSYHYHKLKTETFYVSKGSIRLLYSWSDDIYRANVVELTVGDVFHVPAEMRHQIIALKDSEIFEFSTQHFEEDSYRIFKGD